MITVNQYRALVVAMIVCALLGGTFDMLVPNYLVEEFYASQDMQYEVMAESRAYVIATLAILGMLIFIVAIYGLLRLRPWAPRLSIIASLALLIMIPFMGGVAQSGISYAFETLSSYLWGAVVILPYVPPMRAHFERKTA